MKEIILDKIMRYKIVLYISALVFLLYTCREEEVMKPNIIFIIADDMGYADAGCYGGKKILTPNIDRLAAEGMMFTQHYAGTSVCAPSRCVLMTGLHTGHAVSRGNMESEPYGQFPIPDSSLTVAELLNQAGYATGLFGKWGLGVENTPGDPQKQGFDEFFGYYCQVHAHNSWPEYLYRNGKKQYLDNEVVYMPEDDWSRGLGSYATKKVDYSNDLIVDAAEEFIRQHKDGPFFLYLPVTIPHNNGEAPAGETLEIPEPGRYADSSAWPEEDRIYAAMISHLDDYVGRITGLLDSLDLASTTVVFFTSDNGGFRESALEHNGIFRGMKRDLYEGGIRIPLIARWPGHIQAGTRSEHISAFQDFLPTACELAGIKSPAAIDGISYLPALTGSEQPVHEYLYWEFHEMGKKQAVRMGRWKAIRLNVYEDPGAPLEIYDLENDPSESKDIASDHPDIVREMERIMQVARTDDPNWPLFR